jgi:hypothetical protein
LLKLYMSLKTIQMDPSHLKISKHKKTKKVIVPPSVMINQPNLRQILLDKLMKHRKTQKKNDPMILNNDFDSQCSLPGVGSIPVVKTSFAPSFEPTPVTSVPVTIPVTSILQDKPYGILKNGIKPTYKKWNLSQKNIEMDVQSIPDPFVDQCLREPTLREPTVKEPVKEPTVKEPSTTEPCQTPIAIPVEIVSTEKEYKQPVVVGKSKKTKTVRVLIPCHKTRKLRSELHENCKKTNLTTVKNYLKQHKLIKVGSSAPTNLIREIYENAKSFGVVVNENKQNLLYNFEKEDKES